MNQELINNIVRLEWEMFQETRNVGGRASCQDDYDTFRIMRAGQAAGWSEAMAESWLSDLQAAAEEGRNLVTEKYARMMAYTHPEEYAIIAPALPDVPMEAISIARELTNMVVEWADAASEQYPNFCATGRPIHAEQDSVEETSLETYHFCELLTYSLPTLHLFRDYYHKKKEAEENLYLEIETNTVKRLGYVSLEAAEEAAKNRLKES